MTESEPGTLGGNGDGAPVAAPLAAAGLLTASFLTFRLLFDWDEQTWRTLWDYDDEGDWLFWAANELIPYGAVAFGLWTARGIWKGSAGRSIRRAVNILPFLLVLYPLLGAVHRALVLAPTVKLLLLRAILIGVAAGFAFLFVRGAGLPPKGRPLVRAVAFTFAVAFAGQLWGPTRFVALTLLAAGSGLFSLALFLAGPGAGTIARGIAARRPPRKALAIYWGIVGGLTLVTTVTALAIYGGDLGLDSPLVFPVLFFLGPVVLVLDALGESALAVLIVCPVYFPALFLPTNPHLISREKRRIAIGVQTILVGLHMVGGLIVVGGALAF